MIKELIFGLVVCYGITEATNSGVSQLVEDVMDSSDCLDVVALKELNSVGLRTPNLYIKKGTYDYLLKLSGACGFIMLHDIVFSEKLIPTGETQNSSDISAIKVSPGECAYLSALASIFSGREIEVSDRSLENILFAAKQGYSDAQSAIRLACHDVSYEQAILKGEYRAKECLKNRILGTPYGLEFYRPIALDFSRIISSSSDWREPFKHIASNITYLKNEGNIGYAYAAVQDVCYLYETLKEQYNKYLDNVDFRDNVAAFLLVASRVFADLNNINLSSWFKELSTSVQSKDQNCIANAHKLFSDAATVLESHDGSCSDQI